MIDVVNTRIKAFGTSPQADFVSPSEEPVFILTASQLRGIIQEAIQPFQDRIGDLEKMVVAQGEQIATLTSTQEQDVNRICLDIAYDRQRISKLENKEPKPMQKDRGEILRALIVANGGKMLAKDARQKLRMDKGNFSRLLDTLKRGQNNQLL